MYGARIQNDGFPVENFTKIFNHSQQLECDVLRNKKDSVKFGCFQVLKRWAILFRYRDVVRLGHAIFPDVNPAISQMISYFHGPYLPEKMYHNYSTHTQMECSLREHHKI